MSALNSATDPRSTHLQHALKRPTYQT